MSLGNAGGTGNSSREDSAAGGASGLDDAYWESLLNQGEIVALEEPPPWIGRGTRNSGTGGPDGAGPIQDEWQQAYQYLNEKTCCELTSVGFNRGGLLVQFGRLTDFIPSSHLVGFPIYQDPGEREQALQRRVGRQFRLRLIEIDRDRNRLILSERAALETERCDEIFDRLEPGHVVTGRVSNLRRFGAFVDLGGYEGLVHISEMSWGRVNHPGDVVQPGDTVQVHVLDVNADERKIQLSLKRLQPDPWQSIGDHYYVGQTVEGEVTNVVSFGAFVRLEEGIEGLIHISELAEGNFLHPRNVVSEGDWVQARVLNVDPQGRRIGLSMRHAPDAALPNSAPGPAPQEQEDSDLEITRAYQETVVW